MCGRFRCALSKQELKSCVGVDEWIDEEQFTPSYNIAPGFWVPVLYNKYADDLPSNGQHVLQSMKWGLVPWFTKPDSKPDFWRMFNCRSETMNDKPSFRRLVQKRRCVIPIEGFFEWLSTSKAKGTPGSSSIRKQPYFIYVAAHHQGDLQGVDEEKRKAEKGIADRPPLMYLAGLFDIWEHQNDASPPQQLFSCTILTKDSCPSLRWLHDRMPVILTTEEEREAWLDVSAHATIPRSMYVKQHDGNGIEFHKVTPKMGKLSFQGEECSMPLKEGPTIASMFSPKKETKAEEKHASMPQIKKEPHQSNNDDNGGDDNEQTAPSSMLKRKREKTNNHDIRDLFAKK